VLVLLTLLAVFFWNGLPAWMSRQAWFPDPYGYAAAFITQAPTQAGIRPIRRAIRHRASAWIARRFKLREPDRKQFGYPGLSSSIKMIVQYLIASAEVSHDRGKRNRRECARSAVGTLERNLKKGT
jgi:hypothetical protein